MAYLPEVRRCNLVEFAVDEAERSECGPLERVAEVAQVLLAGVFEYGAEQVAVSIECAESLVVVIVVIIVDVSPTVVAVVVVDPPADV